MLHSPFFGSGKLEYYCVDAFEPVANLHRCYLRQDPVFLRSLLRLVTIYVDSRKRVAGSDSDFEVDLGESLHLQSDARLAVYKIRLADSFLSTALTPRWAR